MVVLTWMVRVYIKYNWYIYYGLLVFDFFLSNALNSLINLESCKCHLRLENSTELPNLSFFYQISLTLFFALNCNLLIQKTFTSQNFPFWQVEKVFHDFIQMGISENFPHFSLSFSSSVQTLAKEGETLSLRFLNNIFPLFSLFRFLLQAPLTLFHLNYFPFQFSLFPFPFSFFSYFLCLHL